MANYRHLAILVQQILQQRKKKLEYSKLPMQNKSPRQDGAMKRMQQHCEGI